MGLAVRPPDLPVGGTPNGFVLPEIKAAQRPVNITFLLLHHMPIVGRTRSRRRGRLRRNRSLTLVTMRLRDGMTCPAARISARLARAGHFALGRPDELQSVQVRTPAEHDDEPGQGHHRPKHRSDSTTDPPRQRRQADALQHVTSWRNRAPQSTHEPDDSEQCSLTEILRSPFPRFCPVKNLQGEDRATILVGRT